MKKIIDDVKYPFKFPNCRIWIVEISETEIDHQLKYFVGEKYFRVLIDYNEDEDEDEAEECPYDIPEIVSWCKKHTKDKIGILVRPKYLVVQFLSKEDLVAFTLQFADIIES